jgi:UDP-3-O-[3-hydroxymyristoyl] glucosamine N-acyltransferase
MSVLPAMNQWESFALRAAIADLLPRNLNAHAEVLRDLEGLACFGKAEKKYLCYCDRNPKSWRKDDESVILCTPDIAKELEVKCPHSILIIVDDARACFIDLARSLSAAHQLEVTSVIPRPLEIASTARIGKNTQIDPEVRIDDDVVIGSNCTIQRGVWLQRGVKVGDGVVIGASGINMYASRDGRLLDFPHLAGVIIGENTSLGVNTVVMKGILTSTVIGEESIIGNLCNIGHGARLGDLCWMSVGCLIGGHTLIETKATFGMGSVVRDNLKIGENAQVGMGSIVVRNIVANASVFGNPARIVPSIAAGPKR